MRTPDAFLAAILAAMERQQKTADDLCADLAGVVAPGHIRDYLAMRAAMNSHKLGLIAAVLGLELKPAHGTSPGA